MYALKNEAFFRERKSYHALSHNGLVKGSNSGSNCINNSSHADTNPRDLPTERKGYNLVHKGELILDTINCHCDSCHRYKV